MRAVADAAAHCLSEGSSAHTVQQKRRKRNLNELATLKLGSFSATFIATAPLQGTFCASSTT